MGLDYELSRVTKSVPATPRPLVSKPGGSVSEAGGTSARQASPPVSPGTGSVSVDSRWAGLRKDWVLWFALGCFGLIVAPYFLPILNPDQLQRWGWYYARIPIAALTLLAVSVSVSSVRGTQERRFWQRIRWAFLAVLGARLAELALTMLPLMILNTVAYLAFYGALFLAVDASRGDVDARPSSRLHHLHLAGVFVLALASVLYFEGLPWLVFSGQEWLWWPSMFLYAALDVVLCYAFLRVRTGHRDPRWRRILAGMALVCGLYAIVDMTDAIFFVSTVPEMEFSPFLDLAWFAGDLAFICVARVHLADTDSESVISGTAPDQPPVQLALIVGSLAMPLVHLALYAQGVLDPGLRNAREAVLIGFLLLSGLVLLLYTRAFEQEKARTKLAAIRRAGELRRQELLQRLEMEKVVRVGQRRFLADAGHEIRTPLTVLRGDLEVALLQVRQPHEYEAVLNRAVEDLRSVSTLAQDLIELARNDTLGPVPSLTSVDISTLMHEVAERFETSARATGGKIELTLTPDLCVDADATLLARAVGNLVDNALKYGPDGQTVVLRSVLTPDGRVELLVSDEGRGLEASDVGQWFERFYRGDQRRTQVQGFGLGLSIALAIMERFGGGASARIGQGGVTEVVLWLPEGRQEENPP